MKKLNKIGLGIIGCGRVARERHMPALKWIPGFEIIAASDIRPDGLEEFSDRYKIKRRYPDYRELLEDPDIDAVGILTPTPSHIEIGLAALEMGKHVFMEKPLALTLSDCDKLIEKSRAANTKSLLCFNLRWHRLVKQAREKIRSGELGNIKAVCSIYTHLRDGRSAQNWHRDLDLGGGVTFNEGVHHFDLWHYLVGGSAERIFAFHDSDQYYQDESSMISGRLSNGILASAYYTFKTSPASEIEIYGDRGRLHVNLYRFDGLRFYPSSIYPGDIGDRLKKAVRSGLDSGGWTAVLRRGGDFQDTFFQIWRHFAGCILHDKQPECVFEDGRRAVKTALAAVASFKSGTMIEIDG